MSLSNCLSTLQDGFAFVNRAITLANTNFTSAADEDVKSFIIESSFLKMFIFWEEFLESSFLCYLNSETSLAVQLPVIYVSPIDSEHAGKMLIGTQKYVDWANHEIVKKLASIYMENGTPYKTALDSISIDLSDLKNIRNRSAHCSSTTERAFLAVQRRVLAKSNSNLKISDFLMHTHPAHTDKNVLEYYQDKLSVVAHNISNCV
ncbi:hypothetical protein [Enterobacter asburiae]|uniref:hypothetical protein n=1 Tax=Enterobacter asburiae TaxID=61645 RepID=UPI00192B52BF|nr:hypothetical protein [Enterobacter asburiae]MBL5926624.1 hypothetical protein [Enterobacter asburiae]MBL5957410.1 hypothetical protein [Enterobacter asburiae]